MGIQGCGKGTQAGLLNERYGWKHVNIGEEFRYHISKQTELGVVAQKYIEKGDLVPDRFVYKILDNALSRSAKGFVLDGFPRNLQQEMYFDEHYIIDKAIFLQLDKNIAIERISARRQCLNCKTDYNLLWKKPEKDGICDLCGGNLVQRDDDKKEVIERRLERYFKGTKPVIDNYRDKGILLEIDANRPIDVVHKEIISQLGL